MKPTTHRSYVVSLILGTCFITACGAGNPPQASLSSAESAVRAAEVGGASEMPRGRLHLKYARDQIADAKAKMNDKDYEAADRLLQRAEVDAQYALALARQKEVQEETQEVLEEIAELMEKAKK